MSCLAIVQETSVSGENGFHGDASALDGISTFQVGQRREAPPPSLMSQVLHTPLFDVPLTCRNTGFWCLQAAPVSVHSVAKCICSCSFYIK